MSGLNPRTEPPQDEPPPAQDCDPATIAPAHPHDPDQDLWAV